MKYFIPYSLSRCFLRQMGPNIRSRSLLLLALFIILETVFFIFTPLFTWTHWQDYKSSKGIGCSLADIYEGVVQHSK